MKWSNVFLAASIFMGFNGLLAYHKNSEAWMFFFYLDAAFMFIAYIVTGNQEKILEHLKSGNVAQQNSTPAVSATITSGHYSTPDEENHPYV